MSTVDDKALAYWRSLPPLRITFHEAEELYEYSATNPTGVVVGKRWRRYNGSFDEKFIRAGGKPRWVICQYEEAPSEQLMRYAAKTNSRTLQWVKLCKITYRPVIRVKAIFEIETQ